jgi:hypothetical protein
MYDAPTPAALNPKTKIECEKSLIVAQRMPLLKSVNKALHMEFFAMQ